MASNSKKKKREEEEDRLSSLTDSVLLHILSFLDMKDVVRTGILSSRWRDLWSSVPNLYLSDANYPAKEDCFVRFVDRTLAFHTAPKIHKFRLCLRNPKNHDSHNVDAWIRFAVKREVEELNIDLFCSIKPSSDGYKLPCWLFKCGALVSLKLSGCKFDVPNLGCFSSLVVLSLKYLDLTNRTLQDLLAGCPLLEDLVIMGFRSLSNVLRISSSSSNLRLKYFTLISTAPVFRDWFAPALSLKRFEVDAPNLQILKVSAIIIKECSFKDMPSLKEAYLYAVYTSSTCNLSSLELSVQNLRHAKVLRLPKCFIQAMHNPTFNDLHSYIFETKYLMLTTGLNKTELPGIANLLWSSPNLDSLDIKLVPPERVACRQLEFNESDYWESLTVSFPCLVHRLKSIKITNFIRRDTDPYGDNNEEISLVRFLLRNAMILEKLAIHASKKSYYVTEEEWPKIMLAVAQKLIAIPRASPYVDVLFLDE